VGEDSEEGSMVGEDQITITIAMKKGISQDIVHYLEDLGVHIAETTLMPLRTVRN
jgi:hypothetical protein